MDSLSTLPPPPCVLALPLRSRFTTVQLRQFFVRLLQPAALLQGLPPKKRGYYHRLFPPLITLWYFLYLRLEEGRVLFDAVTDAHQGGADFLVRQGKPLSQRIRSWATTALCKARQRLPRPALIQALESQAQTIRSWVRDLLWHGWNIILLDGSTVRLRPLGDIPQHFPPHKNRQPQRQYWCLMRVVVGFCLRSAVLVGTAVGSLALGEQALASPLIAAAAPHSLFVGDRNFGIFHVFQMIRQAHAQGLMRLTEVRARKLAGGQRLDPGLDLLVAWAHSRHDHLEPGTATNPVDGRLLVQRVERKGFRTQVLYLFTTLLDATLYPPSELLELYGWRWHAELNLRYVKAEMALGALTCKSAELAQKEWLAGLMAYNLIRAAMVAAAVEAQLPMLQLSFSAARTQVARWVIEHRTGPAASIRSWFILLQGMAAARHPKRQQTRPSEPRAKRKCSEVFPPLWGSRQQAREKLAQDQAKR